MRLRVGACQILSSNRVADNADKIVGWMRRAAEDSVDVVSFPEACLTGYSSNPNFRKLADMAKIRAAEARIVKAAKRFRIAVVAGTVNRDGRKFYNSLLVVDRDGQVRGHYAKTHLAESWPDPGQRLPLWKVCGVPSSFLVCHDIRYPELVRLPAVAGARICYFCSNESGLTHEYKLSAYRAMPISRATENSIYLVMANCPADPRNIASAGQSHGNSKIIHPDGNVLCEAGHFEERIVAATIDLKAADRCMAIRARDDDTILRTWMRDGLRLVDHGGRAGGGKRAPK